MTDTTDPTTDPLLGPITALVAGKTFPQIVQIRADIADHLASLANPGNQSFPADRVQRHVAELAFLDDLIQNA